eukprot:m.219572 g.219572  ORF g.219572 m.219572 type:complete len:675 (+) comp33296_c2_seq5:61-2085(+)
MNSFLFLFLRRLLPSPSTSSNIFPIRGMELTMVSFAVVLLVIMTQTHVDAVSVANVKFSNPAGQCGETTDNNTLGYVSPNGVTMVIAKDAADCCSACTDKPNCASWSMQHEWTPTTPCHLSPYAFVKKHANSPGNSCGTIRDAPPAPPPPPPGPPAPTQPNGVYLIDTSTSGHRQVFEGVEVELMCDSIGSDNQGMPGDGTLVPDDSNTTLGVPHDLAPSERVRFATEVMSGVRTIRLAMGLYLRGLSSDNKSIIGRWPSQMEELKQLQTLSGIEGWAPEYWSPPPGWKDSQSYYSGTLQSFTNVSFIKEFANSVVRDVQYLQEAGLVVTSWGLQNEPGSSSGNITCNNTSPLPPLTVQLPETAIDSTSMTDDLTLASRGNTYSRCAYSQCDYFVAFRETAKQIRELDPTIRIHANSQRGQLAASPIANDPETLPLVDAWTWHTVNQASSGTFGNNTHWAYGKLDFTNEMEYQPGSPYAGTPVGTVSCVNSFLNTLTFKNSPTGVIMLHAMKPTTNLESLGYGWTWWRSTGTPASPEFPDLQPNHFEYNYWNWNSVAPFVKTVPWNSIRLNVMEDTQRIYQRVVAFQTPQSGLGGPLHTHTAPDKLIVVVTNEYHTPYNTTIKTTDGVSRTWVGYSFSGSPNSSTFNISLGPPKQMSSVLTTLPPNSIQWWYEV